MISYDVPQNSDSGCITNCTTASTFEKLNSLKFEILFGDYQRRLSQRCDDKNIVNAFDYVFLPNQIFGFSYESTGSEYKKFHHTFVLRACSPGETGTIIPGISPGAEILLSTLTTTASIRLKSIFQKLVKSNIDLAMLPASRYRHLNCLLEIKANTDFFVGELIEQQRN